jgi:hypothetical protein
VISFSRPWVVRGVCESGSASVRWMPELEGCESRRWLIGRLLGVAHVEYCLCSLLAQTGTWLAGWREWSLHLPLYKYIWW